MTGIERTRRRRPCAREGCGVWFDEPVSAADRVAPAGFCSTACHAAAKPPRYVPARNARPRNGTAKPKRRAISPASPEQRADVRDQACVVCRGHAGACHPAHVIDRSLCGEGADDPRAVVPLCPEHHRAYDDGAGQGTLDLLPYLEPHRRDVLAFAVERVGLMATVRRVTNERRQALDALSQLSQNVEGGYR